MYNHYRIQIKKVINKEHVCPINRNTWNRPWQMWNAKYSNMDKKTKEKWWGIQTQTPVCKLRNRVVIPDLLIIFYGYNYRHVDGGKRKGKHHCWRKNSVCFLCNSCFHENLCQTLNRFSDICTDMFIYAPIRANEEK